MARIVLGTYLFRYPLGGLNRWTLGWLRGLTDLGHDVFVVERATGGGACYDPVRKLMTDDCRYGISIVGDLLERSGLGGRWCFVDAEGTHHGMRKRALDRLFHSADLFVGMLWKEWLAEASASGLRVFVDGEPGYFQMELAAEHEDEADSHGYDHYFTTGLNVGTDAYTGPTAGIDWRPLLLSPVSVSRFALGESPRDAPFTTVMNWRSHRTIQFEGKSYGQKDEEFLKFLGLPGRTTTALEIAASGSVPTEMLLAAGWRVRDADRVAETVESYLEYIALSRGEFSVAKNVFVATNSGEFSERSGCYLASGRPVVAQETGFSSHLPCGHGLFAVRSQEEAAAALDEIEGDYESHSRWAREIAHEYLDAEPVMRRFMNEIGL